MRNILPATLTAFLSIAAPLCASAQSFEQLLTAGGDKLLQSPRLPAVTLARADGMTQAVQYLPPNNNEPGFEWPGSLKGPGEDFFYIGGSATFLKASAVQAETLVDGSGKCALTANTLYKASAKPGFVGEHMIVALAAPLPGCSVTRGFVYMSHVSSSSAGGAWELPKTVRAFLDTLAYAEGTVDRYNLSFTFVTFNSYADHPRKVYHSGSLYSSAAGRYQFMPDTWDPLAKDLGLQDFTPPSQEKAGLELIRRAGAYNKVHGSSNFENFKVALTKLNRIWASLPGSPYGQPTHSTAALWKAYKAALAKY